MPPGMQVAARSAKSLTSSLMETLAEIETRFPVAQWTVDSLPVWPLIRVRWFFTEWNRSYAGLPPVPSTTRAVALAVRLLSGPPRALLAQWRDRGKAPLGPARRDLLFLSDGVSYGQLGGRWLERFCDPVIRAAERRGLTTRLLCPGYGFRLPRATPSHFIQPLLDRANLRGALRAAFPLKTARLPAIEELGAWLRARGFGITSLQPKKVTSDAVRVLALSHAYSRLIRRTRPRLAFVVSYYGIEGMAFVLACRRAGVVVVDFQHGAPGELHPGYARLPQPARGAHPLVPDRFWVWSDWEQRLIDTWAHETEHRAVIGGDPWMSVWQDRRSWPAVAESVARSDALLERAAGRPVVLITLQWGLNPGEQLEPMQRLIAAGQRRFAFWVRLHPAMLERREEVRALLGSVGRYELDEPTDLPLPAVLSRSALHVTHSSSTAVEAAQFGVRTVLTSELGGELYVRLADSGWVVTETGDAARVLEALERLLAHGRPFLAQPQQIRLEAALDELLAESSAQGAKP
jgi:hypothetical protein